MAFFNERVFMSSASDGWACSAPRLQRLLSVTEAGHDKAGAAEYNLPLFWSVTVAGSVVCDLTWRMQSLPEHGRVYLLLIVWCHCADNPPRRCALHRAFLALDYYFTPPMFSLTLSETRTSRALRLSASPRAGHGCRGSARAGEWRNAFEIPDMYFWSGSKWMVFRQPFGDERLGTGR